MIRNTKLPSVVFLQGPPHSGKDTIANLLSHCVYYTHLKFAQPIIDAMKAQFKGAAEDMDSFKKQHFGSKGVTGRAIMIRWSEEYMKPLFGQDVFGHIMAKNLQIYDSFFVISDSGFEAESIPVIEEIGADRCVIIQLYRPGCNFTGDSRSYWYNPEVATFSYFNTHEGVENLQKDFADFFNEKVFAKCHTTPSQS